MNLSRLRQLLTRRADPHYHDDQGWPTDSGSSSAKTTNTVQVVGGHDPHADNDQDHGDIEDADLGGWFTPGGVRVGARMVRTERGVVSVLAVTGYPSVAYPGWLAPLLSHPGPVDVSLHVEPVDPIVAAEKLKRRRGRLAAGLAEDARAGRVPDPAWEAADDGAAELAARIARAETRLFRLAVYLAVHADTPQALADEVEALRRLAASFVIFG